MSVTDVCEYPLFTWVVRERGYSVNFLAVTSHPGATCTSMIGKYSLGDGVIGVGFFPLHALPSVLIPSLHAGISSIRKYAYDTLLQGV